MNIKVDVRERAFIEVCQTKIAQYPHITMEIVQLSLGDMEIYYNDDLLFVWERKTFSDLLASIKDGRYTEQSHRLIHNYGPSKVVYLIEGIMTQLPPEDKKKVISTMTSLSLHKNFHVWRSVHVQDSVDCFLMVCDKLYRDAINGRSNTETPRDYCDSIKKVKKENITPENIGEIFLCQIPDVSNTSAKAIMQHVNGDFSQISVILREKPNALDDIKIGTTKPRKISKKVIENVKKYLRLSKELKP